MKLEKECYIGNVGYDIVGDENYKEYRGVKIIICIPRANKNEMTKLYNIQKEYRAKITLEVEEPILDEAERKYLSGVIKPFRDRVKYIKKKGCDNIEYIAIIIKNDDNLMFPNFEKGTMYKNLELNKEYTLDDLNL